MIYFCWLHKIGSWSTLHFLWCYANYLMKTKGSVYIYIYIHITFCFHEVICITSQKVQSRSTPNFMQPAEINQDKKFVYMQLCTSLQWISPRPSVAYPSVMQLVYNYDWKSVAFSRIFRWQSKFHEGFSFRLCKSTIHSLIFWFFWTNAEIFEREKIVQIFVAAPSWVLFTWPASLVPGLLVHKNVTGVVQMVAFDRAAAKQQKKTKKTS